MLSRTVIYKCVSVCVNIIMQMDIVAELCKISTDGYCGIGDVLVYIGFDFVSARCIYFTHTYMFYILC